MKSEVISLFKKEQKGAPIIEFIIVLCLIGLMSATIFPELRVNLNDWTNTMTNNISDAIKEAPNPAPTPTLPPPLEEPEPPNIPKEPIAVNLYMNAPEDIVPGTPISFSAVATGGTAPYVMNWTNYEGKTNGSEGVPAVYPIGGHTVRVVVTDDEGDTKVAQKSFYVNPLPASLVVSDEYPHVGDTVTAEMAVSEGVNCYFTNPSFHSGCIITFTPTTDAPIPIKGTACFDGTCEVVETIIQPQFATIDLDLVPSKSGTIGASEGIAFKAVVSNGSGNYSITWTEYNGPDANNVFGPVQVYGEGMKTISVKACDNVSGICAQESITVEFVFDGPLPPIRYFEPATPKELQHKFHFEFQDKEGDWRMFEFYPNAVMIYEQIYGAGTAPTPIPRP